MKGDFTRFTHDGEKHFNRLYRQQGRVELDADFNEAADLATELARVQTVDVIGRTGVPKDDSFKIEVAVDNTDLVIHRGTIYVDGIRCALEKDALYTQQPGDVGQPPLNPVVNRRDLVYLEVFERHITWVEDPELLEPALSGIDTCTRVQTVARVRVLTGIGAGTCGNVPGWPPPASGGRLTTDTKAAAPAPNPCVIPATAGFRGLENRLYRIEVTAGGGLANATFVWSRDNGAVVVPVEFLGGQSRHVKARTLGRDQVLGFRVGDWVELASEETDLNLVAGTLAQIVSITSDLVVELSKDISAQAVQTRPKLRRWDQGGEALSMQGGAVIDLEDGITARFSGNNFQPGDYWMFSARVGTDVEKLNAAPPTGVVRHYTPLAIIQWQADPIAPGGIQAQVDSCRSQFPTITDIEAGDVKFDGKICQFGTAVTNVQQAIDALCQKQDECCTIVVRPGPDWQQVLASLPSGGVHLCFCPGVYEIPNRIQIEGIQSIVMSGAGEATQIVSTADECALMFVNCRNVTIRDLAAIGKAPRNGRHQNEPGILGVFALTKVDSVLVENCSLTSADGPHRTMACLSVNGATNATVRGNRFRAGIQQVGLILVNVSNTNVEGNLITGRFRSIRSLMPFLRDPQFIASVRSRLLTHLSVGRPPRQGVAVNVAEVKVGGQPIWFQAPDTHVSAWINLLGDRPLSGNPSAKNIIDHIEDLAEQVLMRDVVPSFSGVRGFILGNTTVSSQGITIGGTVADNVSIRNNRVSVFMQAIHVGLSAPSPNVAQAEHVVIHDNVVGVTLGIGPTRGRHGIFVGNVNSLSIRGNRLALTPPGSSQSKPVDGIRVFGRLGRMAIIRENHLTGFDVGIRFELRGQPPTAPMWMINDNLAVGSNLVVSAPNSANKTNNFG
jgi:hypothetical protein